MWAPLSVFSCFDLLLYSVQLLQNRVKRRLLIQEGKWTPEFQNRSESLEWKINDLPDRLRNRKLDLGDVSPANTIHFTDCLYAEVQGIQVSCLRSFRSSEEVPSKSICIFLG